MPIFAVVHDFIRQELKLTNPQNMPEDFSKMWGTKNVFAGEITEKIPQCNTAESVVFCAPLVGENQTIMGFTVTKVNVDDIADTSVVGCRLSANTGYVNVSSTRQNFRDWPASCVYTHENHLEEREKETSKHSTIFADIGRTLKTTVTQFSEFRQHNSGQEDPDTVVVLLP